MSETEIIIDKIFADPKSWEYTSWSDKKSDSLNWNLRNYNHFGENTLNIEPPKLSENQIIELLKELTYKDINPFSNNTNVKAFVKLNKDLLGKSISVGKYQLHFNITHFVEDHRSNDRDYPSLECDVELNIVVSFNGLYLPVAEITAYCKYSYDKTKDKSLQLKEINWYTYGHGINKHAYAMVKSLTTCEINYIESITEITEYVRTQKYGIIETICENLSGKHFDIKSIIESDIVKGVYRPNPLSIKTYFDNYRSKVNHSVYKKFPIKSLGVHTIQLKSDAHFSVEYWFDLTGVKVKASKIHIKKYGLEKYCANDKLVESIKQEQIARDEKYKKISADNKFSLIKKGKVLFDNVDKEKIIEYLEAYVPTDKDVTESYRQQILDFYAPILKKYKLETYEIAYWGTYYKYECSGETMDISYECPNKHINENVLENILDEVGCFDLDDKLVEINFGWPDRGAYKLVIVKENDKYFLRTEDYDVE